MDIEEKNKRCIARMENEQFKKELLTFTTTTAAKINIVRRTLHKGRAQWLQK
jgi:hypothetical protein